MPTESLLYLMVLYTVVNFEWWSKTYYTMDMDCAALPTGLKSRVSPACGSLKEWTDKEDVVSLYTFFLLFQSILDLWRSVTGVRVWGWGGWGVPTTVCTQQLIQHSFSVSKRSQELQAGRQLQTAPEQQSRLCLSNCRLSSLEVSGPVAASLQPVCTAAQPEMGGEQKTVAGG